MPLPSGNEFFDASLRFRLTKPQSWNFLPPAWSPVAQLQNYEPSEDDWITLAKKPFCCAMGTHESKRHAYPTLQVTVRPLRQPLATERAELLAQSVQFLTQQYENLEVLETTDAIQLAGYPATRLLARFDLLAVVDDEPVDFSVLSRSYTVFASNKAFVVGLSSSEDPDYYDEREIAAIVASISIDA